MSPDSKVLGANMGPIWGRQDTGGTHVGPMNFAIWIHKIGLMFKIINVTDTQIPSCAPFY